MSAFPSSHKVKIKVYSINQREMEKQQAYDQKMNAVFAPIFEEVFGNKEAKE